ncbi:hypothetical protein EV356DRAFT_442033 [Viridothelium virens]|uniref:HRDC domain-containing protein n=1 Tax=Viridothelium virens TaxID=1048519 RepID=A0A6A6HI45_VIRVR|nr:hypothetical protein EV356DRAFT_442033 [Viridothelium virens]
MESGADFTSIRDSISFPLLATTRLVNQVAAEDLDFQRASNPSVADRLDRDDARLLRIAKRLLGSSAASSGIVRPQLDDADDIETNWTGVVDVIDSLLEKADTTLDEFSGVLKRASPPNEQASTPKSKPHEFNAFRNQNLAKPQRLFEHVPVNQFTGSFRPLLTTKPHAIVPYSESMKPVTEEDGTIHYPHPYQTEIEQYQYPSAVHTEAIPIPYQPFGTTTATLVDTPEKLEEMLKELKGASEIAIDLEHHDHRSYIGIVSLMQISTRNKDWIVDTLKPWRRKLEVLNEVFTDPRILKVFHGSHMDNMWLQRDFGLYVVGMFDTYHAASALGYSGRSLAFLLRTFINFEAQKQYQTADWRMRPLPTELFDYARSDTHFLLYIYDCMRNELIQRSSSRNPENDKFQDVLENSKLYNLQRFENPFYDADHGEGSGGWSKLLVRTPSLLSKEQFSIFRAVHKWRDELARKLDESTNYILTNAALFNIAQSIPMNESNLFSAIKPTSPPVRQHKNELLGVIAKAKIAGQNGPEMGDLFDHPKLRQEDIPQIQAPASFSAPMLPAPTNTSGHQLFSTAHSHSLRAFASKFWGASLNRQGQEQRRTLATDSIRLTIPLPKLNPQIYESITAVAHLTDQSSPTGAIETSIGSDIPHRRAAEREPETENSPTFTIVQLGGKRKRGQDSGSADHPQTSSSVNGAGGELEDQADEMSQEQKQAKKRATRRAKKARQRASRAAARVAEGGQEGDDDENENEGAAVNEEEPFDYANAPSVLHAQTEEKGSRGKKEAFNPYVKATDAPKGLGKVQRESAGRSGTFMG